MNFHNNLVKPLELLDWKVLESLVLSSLDVNLQEPMLIGEVVPFDHVIQGKIGVPPCILSDVPDTLTVKPCLPIASIGTCWHFQVSAVVLVVRDVELFRQGASKRVSAFNSEVDEALNILEIVLAEDVASLVCVADASVLAVCVLNIALFTL